MCVLFHLLVVDVWVHHLLEVYSAVDHRSTDQHGMGNEKFLVESSVHKQEMLIVHVFGAAV